MLVEPGAAAGWCLCVAAVSGWCRGTVCGSTGGAGGAGKGAAGRGVGWAGVGVGVVAMASRVSSGGTTWDSPWVMGEAGVKGVIFLRKRLLRLVSALLPCTFTR